MKNVFFLFFLMIFINAQAETNEDFPCFAVYGPAFEHTEVVFKVGHNELFNSPNEIVNEEKCFLALTHISSLELERSGKFVYQNKVTGYRNECAFEVVSNSSVEVRSLIHFEFSKGTHWNDIFHLLQPYKLELFKSVNLDCGYLGV